MHKSSLLRMKYFVNNYVVGGEGKRILDVGSCNIGGCYRPLFSNINIEYIGLDIENGPNVDVIIDELYCWDSLENESFDYIISGQTFEHIEYPWLTIKEIYKKLKPDGIICIIAPNGLYEHKFPVDCYRYYADGMKAIANWAGFKVIEVSVAGIPTEQASLDWDDIWNDVCLVACKSKVICDKFINKPMFPIERRYSPIKNLKLQCDFISEWKNRGNRVDEIIIDYIKEKKYDEIYIIGYENIGVLLVNLLKSKNIKYQIIKTEVKPVAEDYFLETGKIINLNLIKNNALCILTILDVHRILIKDMKEKYNFSKVIYIDDFVKEGGIFSTIKQMRKFFQKCKDIYIYGAGINGCQIFEILNEYSFNISGFVVSNEYYQENKNVKNIYKISEVSVNSGIIISPNEDKLIKETLKDLKFQKCFDGKKLLKFQKYFG